jgi:hypothetical protein
MKKILFQTLSNLFLMAIVFKINAQSPSSSKIYMPLDIRQAYEKGTRTYEGLPGKNFWQKTKGMDSLKSTMSIFSSMRQ